MNREGRAAAGVTIELRENHARESDALVEPARDFHRVLPRHPIGDEQYFLRPDSRLQRLQLVHHLGVDLQAAGGIDDHRTGTRRFGLAQGILHQRLYGRSMLRPYSDAKHRHSNLLAQLLQLFGRRRPIDVGRNQCRRLLLELQPPREFGRGSGLPRSL